MLTKHMIMLGARAATFGDTQIPSIAIVFLEPGPEGAPVAKGKGVRLIAANPTNMLMRAGAMSLMCREATLEGFADAIEQWSDSAMDTRVGIGICGDEVQIAEFESGALICSFNSNAFSYNAGIDMSDAKSAE